MFSSETGKSHTKIFEDGELDALEDIYAMNGEDPSINKYAGLIDEAEFYPEFVPTTKGQG